MHVSGIYLYLDRFRWLQDLPTIVLHHTQTDIESIESIDEIDWPNEVLSVAREVFPNHVL